MIDFLQHEIEKHGDKGAIIPVQRLQDIRQDIEELKGKGGLNNFQQYILDHIYQLDLPDTGFKIHSIILVASSSPPIARLNFTWQGKNIPVMLPASYTNKTKAPQRIGNYLNGFLTPIGSQVLHAPQLPHKLLAVRSGLAMYGRNNICYVEGMGSFLNLNLFFSDLPCTQETWQKIRHMDVCRTCQVCFQNCPTGAILPTRFLIDNERCLTYFNEAGGEWDFPAWIDPAVHHTLYGCMRCQSACPVNRAFLSAQVEPVEFSEDETGFLLERKPFDLFPEELKQKILTLEMEEYLGAIPRNFRVLLNQVN